MKLLKNKTTINKLKYAIIKWHRQNSIIPDDGYLRNITNGAFKNGIRYQCDIINDSRFYKTPIITLFIFKDTSNLASHHLSANILEGKAFIQ